MIAVLKSQIATLIVLTLALLAQLPHAAEVFMIAGNVHGVAGWLHGLSYAIALELAVLLFVVQARRNESYGFALVSVLVNLAYYAERVQLFSVQALPAWLISLALPVAIALYSHAIANDSLEVHAPDWAHMLLHRLQRRQSAHVEAQSPMQSNAIMSDDSTQSIAQLDYATIEEVQVQPGVQSLTQLDDIDTMIVEAVRNGNHTPYAISKVVPVSLTTLKRKRAPGSDEYVGRIPQLVASGVLHNSSGSNGNEYRLAK